MFAKPLVAVLLAAVLAGSVAGTRHVRGLQAGPAGPQQEKRIKGSPSAKLFAVEYFDYQCGACRTAYQLFEEYERAFPGSVRVEMRYYPLPGHAHGMKAAIHAECASVQDKFWPFHDRMMRHQAEWSRLPDAVSTFRRYAAEAGVDTGAFDACVADPQTEIRVLKEKEAGMALGVKLTPTCIINGELAAGSKAIAQALEKVLGPLQNTHG